jgi:hypothetical protein
MRKNKTKTNGFIEIICLIVVTVGAVVGITLAEPASTFMNGCFDKENGHAVSYISSDNNKKCPTSSDKKELIFKNVPIRVNSNDNNKENTIKAIEWWNKELKMELFIVSELQTTSDIFITSQPLSSARNVLGSTSHRLFGHNKRLISNIEIRTMNNKPLITTIHELGHAIGLDHDIASNTSIMRPKLGEDWMFLEKDDKKAIKKRYKR